MHLDWGEKIEGEMMIVFSFGLTYFLLILAAKNPSMPWVSG